MTSPATSPATFAHDLPGTPAGAWQAAIADRVPLVRLVPLVELVGSATRVVVLAAHPDDETLGAGGFVALAHRAGLDVAVVVATRGERCHPRSPTHSPERLAELRSVELDEAVEVLAPGTRAVQLGLPDGGLTAHEDDLVVRFVELVGDGRDTLLVAPWRGDGHPDHEAVGRAASTAAARTGARLLEYPVWFWHWGDPADPTAAPWAAGLRLGLDTRTRETKQAAIARHRSQVAPLSPAPGDEVLLTPAFLEHFAASYEVLWEGAATDDALDALHERQDDPWGVDRRWYERRKRALLLAMLPRERFRRGVEVGCSTGALAAELVQRCDELVALDASPAAVAAARDRLPGADVRLGTVPEDWPEGTYDLVVVSEVGYFLSPRALDGLVARIVGSLAPDGVVVLCHWRHPVRGWPLDGADVHATLGASSNGAGLPPVIASYRDRDVELLVLTDPDHLPDPHA